MVSALTIVVTVITLLLASAASDGDSSFDGSWRAFVLRSVKEEDGVERGTRQSTEDGCAAARQTCTTTFYNNQPTAGYSTGDSCRAMATFYKCSTLAETGCIDSATLTAQLQQIDLYYQNCPP